MWYNAWQSIGDLKELISKNYKIKVYSIEPVRKIMKLTTDQGTKALKIINLPYDQYIFTCEAMNHARRNGFPNIPKVIKTRDNKLGVRLKKGILSMNDWIEGAREVNYDNEMDLKLATIALSRLHRASQNFKPSSLANPRNLWGKCIKNMNTRCMEMYEFKKIAQNKKNKSCFDKNYIKFADYFCNIGRKSIKHLEESNYYAVCNKNKSKNTFCHNDLGSANVLLTKKNDCFFIDFDNCILDITIYDLANFILKNIRYRPLNMHKVYFILNTYCKENPISQAEIKVMKAFMEFPHEFWEFGVRYYLRSSKYPWSEEKFNEKLRAVINDIPLMEAFLKKF